MTKETNPTTLTRRALLGRAASAGSLAVIGGGFMAAPNASWALTVNVISSHHANCNPRSLTLSNRFRHFRSDRIFNAYYAYTC